MKGKFMVGDRVWDIRRGWGIVKEILIDEKVYPVGVEFVNSKCYYTICGRLTIADLNESIYFKEIEIPTSACLRPKWRANVCEKYWYVNSLGNIAKDIENDRSMHYDRFSVGNYFETVDEAKDSKFYKVFNNKEEE